MFCTAWPAAPFPEVVDTTDEDAATCCGIVLHADVAEVCPLYGAKIGHDAGIIEPNEWLDRRSMFVGRIRRSRRSGPPNHGNESSPESRARWESVARRS